MIGLFGCEEKQAVITPKLVVVEKVNASTVPLFGNYIGVTQASLDVEVRARVDGFVEDKSFIEGSAVKEGAVLYRIDNRPYLAVVNRLKANVESQQSALDKAHRDVERLKPLYEQDATSQLDFDNALSVLSQARSSLAASKAELEEAELELSYTEIKSPISGLVSRSEVDIGALVGSNGQSLLTRVKQVDPIYVTFNMSALDYLNARRRMTSYSDKKEAEVEGKAVEGFVSITLPDNTEYPYLGDVRFTDPSVNPETGTFQVRAELPNPNKELLPGQYTNVRIKLNEISNAVVIPQKATQVEQGGVYVMVVLPNNKVERRFIVIEHQGKMGVVVKSGLRAGELVIVEGMHRVRHGQLAEPLSQQEYQTREDKIEKEQALKQQALEQEQEQ
ncbi:efflux RND transporter periplasmic adaptor subunit [Shewanella fidelis]|uniref:Efflux RND transporter periplasmic adaptor subunit n=1 Tax=Shewanella fidelis TaxID=173509 RepID=A0AAW8NNK2_9GAMM|nr:efflux RND transporter periplasmic adaptor subunit [Shewanella fidelis]MDR8524768.1 efflux RND transporter periplasmic adaptor subunit [Shewanella fidelis]MDW4810839.1 efflux RND transporter periplasmic adaptor subunit [Shewanella fidelis]MDW4815382.1 efflux RND transporter periplasmic adaptor subunit [Shewanella fidelis]MDW4819472.1 efflux RND transporter periplasmic adaptor subunit [Shewanella fidelis]MDW4822850.1 efflux RND transporter periplasmic adaptor subunit [Shewanella fidelis]